MTGVFVELLHDFEEWFDGTELQRFRNRIELECQRQEWNRHPVERHELEAGMDRSDLRH